MSTVVAHRTVLAVSTGGSAGTYNEIAEVFDIKGPNLTRAVIDVTPLNNATTVRQKKPGLVDPGDLTFTLRPASDNAQWAALISSLSQFTDGTTDSLNPIKYFKVQPSDVGTTSDGNFSGFLSGVSPSYELDNVYVVDATITCTGGVFTVSM